MKNSSPYKGIALFGPPGSGKTETGKALKQILLDFSFMEAAERVIYPAAGIRQLPKTIEGLASLLAARTGPASTSLPRAEAQATYRLLVSTYGPDAVGKIIELVDTDHLRPQVVSGVRGSRNAEYLQRNGYLTVFLTAQTTLLQQRIAARDGISAVQAEIELHEEESLYQTSDIGTSATLSFDTATFPADFIAQRIKESFFALECAICLNTSLNPTTPIGTDGLCPICRQYSLHFDPKALRHELALLLGFRGSCAPYDVMVGLSGGKDSSATAHLLKELGFSPLAFTFDLGYYPPHIFERSQQVAGNLGIPHQRIDIRSYISRSSYQCYRETANLYDQPDSPELARTFRELYASNRRHYSVKDEEEMPFVRSCQICRKSVIPAYFAEARKRGISVVALGINEWTGLSQEPSSSRYAISGIRRLKPHAGQPPVYVVHLPFLLRIKRADLPEILSEIGWSAPDGEDLIESNSNSCLFARAAEAKAFRMLGFHPDITRLSREISAGFVSKEEARAALKKSHPYPLSVREVLSQAGVSYNAQTLTPSADSTIRPSSS